ncbi:MULTISPECIES: outer membrane protein assembly factor BamB family protein [unclassified Sphingomonas]|jgi:outer membrane protein assembly factor BamB|uniref:outer membrane protein assembly factor BamB family protein n=1 Tax=unclassified Sphingomonas TaxID=196159 RepID=UPI0008338196|nr:MULTISPECIES: PQQ-binding-like beta-propeller repeat protein [unclassified Sphingomonas]MCH4893113.1 PQQ-binding-like beta-propeller repeat protein [Sphingomonas sp. SFZ2018-12]
MKSTVRATTAIVLLAALSACGVFKGGPKRTPVVGQRVPILVTENEIKADPTIASIQVIPPVPVANPTWTQPGGNAAKSMGHLGLGDPIAPAWSVRIPGGTTRVRLAASPVVADGRIYLIDSNATVHALSADNGATLWKRATAGDENRGARFGGGVSIEGNRVFAANGLGDVVALNADDGAELWRAKPGGPLRGSPTLASGNLYVLSQDNQLFALSQADGSVLWSQSGSIEPQGVFGVAAPAYAQGTVVAGYSSGELNAYRYENGRSVWADTLSRTSITTSVSALADIDAEPVIDQGRVYAVGEGGRMVAVEVVSGQRLWEQNLGGVATPWLAGEWLFVVTDDARLVCIARASGKIRWISQLPRYRKEKSKKGPITWRGPVLAGGRLLLVNSQGDIVSAAVTDGSITTTMKRAVGPTTLSPVVANNMLLILDDSGRLTAFR